MAQPGGGQAWLPDLFKGRLLPAWRPGRCSVNFAFLSPFRKALSSSATFCLHSSTLWIAPRDSSLRSELDLLKFWKFGLLNVVTPGWQHLMNSFLACVRSAFARNKRWRIFLRDLPPPEPLACAMRHAAMPAQGGMCTTARTHAPRTAAYKNSRLPPRII